MPKLYKAVDSFDGEISAFTAYHGLINSTIWTYSVEEEIALAKGRCIDRCGFYIDADDFEKRVINPIFIAEW